MEGQKEEIPVTFLVVLGGWVILVPDHLGKKASCPQPAYV